MQKEEYTDAQVRTTSGETTTELKEQAVLLRQLIEAARNEPYLEIESRWKKLLCGVFFVATLCTVVFLLIGERSRQQVIVKLVEGLSQLQRSKAEIFKLPPPPPKRTISRTKVPAIAALGNKKELTGVSYSDQLSLPGEQRNEVRQVAVAQKKDARNMAAYILLREHAEIVDKLVNDKFPGYKFKEWKAVRNDPPEFWIELTVWRQSDGEELQLTWSVNTENDSTSALSQAARDLESRTPE